MPPLAEGTSDETVSPPTLACPVVWEGEGDPRAGEAELKVEVVEAIGPKKLLY